MIHLSLVFRFSMGALKEIQHFLRLSAFVATYTSSDVT